MKDYKFVINGNNYDVSVNDIEDTLAEVEVNGTPYKVTIDRPMKKAASPVPARAPRTAAPQAAKSPAPTPGANASTINSPLPGVVLEVCVKEGQTVKAGQKLIVLEAMKMENNIEADKDGVVSVIKVNKGDSVLEGAPLVILG